MSELREFVAELMEQHGAAVQALDPDGLEVLAPEPVREKLGWPELVHLGFSGERGESIVSIGLEGDWIDRFGTLLDQRGRWSERQLVVPHPPPLPTDPESVLEKALDLPNAAWRLVAMNATVTRCLLLAFRYTAVSDDKREGLIWLGFNLGTGAVLDGILERLRLLLAKADEWLPVDPTQRNPARPSGFEDWLTRRLGSLVDRRVRQELEPFLRAMRRRLERDGNRVHVYHDELRRSSLRRLAALDGARGDRARADRQRETLRVAAIEREYHAKLDDLRHNYALRVSVDWVQALEVVVPVQRFDVLIRRRKRERRIALDWHALLRLAELPVCEAGFGAGRTRLVCDAALHLTDSAAQDPCPSCGKAWCRACDPAGCPRCGAFNSSSHPAPQDSSLNGA